MNSISRFAEVHRDLDQNTVPEDLRVTPFKLGDETLAVLSYVPRRFEDTVEAQLEPLPSALREVGLGLLHGLSHKDIARVRGVKVRTVANQVAAIYSRFEVNSRTELIAKLICRSQPPEPHRPRPTPDADPDPPPPEK